MAPRGAPVRADKPTEDCCSGSYKLKQAPAGLGCLLQDGCVCCCALLRFTAVGVRLEEQGGLLIIFCNMRYQPSDRRSGKAPTQ